MGNRPQIRSGIINNKKLYAIEFLQILPFPNCPFSTMSDYFNPLEACPMSKELLHHHAVTTVRCGPCGLLNPTFESALAPTKVPARAPAKPPLGTEIISIDDSPVPIRPAQRRGLATHVPTLPDLKLGYAEKERQVADQRVGDRKTKTGHISPIPSQHFSIGVARFTWDEFAEDNGNWSTLPNHWTVVEDNRLLTSDGLLTSILTTLRTRLKRANLNTWLSPAVAGDWCLGHINPTKGGREIATWDEPKLLSDVIESGTYDQNKVQGSARKIVTLWLYWTPEPEPIRQDPPTPTPKKEPSVKKEKGIKIEKGVKQEANIKLEPSTPAAKRARPISTTPSIPRVTRRQAMDLPQEGEDEGDVEFGKDWPGVDDGDIGDGEVASIA